MSRSRTKNSANRPAAKMIKYSAPETLALCCGDRIGFIGKVSQLLRSASIGATAVARQLRRPPERWLAMRALPLLTKAVAPQTCRREADALADHHSQDRLGSATRHPAPHAREN